MFIAPSDHFYFGLSYSDTNTILKTTQHKLISTFLSLISTKKKSLTKNRRLQQGHNMFERLEY